MSENGFENVRNGCDVNFSDILVGDREIETYSEFQEENFFIYQREGRWQIGPDPNSKLCWLFSTKTEKGCDEYIRWFEPVKDKWTRNRTVTVAPVK